MRFEGLHRSLAMFRPGTHPGSRRAGDAAASKDGGPRPESCERRLGAAASGERRGTVLIASGRPAGAVLGRNRVWLAPYNSEPKGARWGPAFVMS